MEYNYFFCLYKNENNEKNSFIDKESNLISLQHMCRDMKYEIKKRGVKHPVFAIEQITKEQFDYLRRKGYYHIGVE